MSGPAHLGAHKCTSVPGLSPATIRAAVSSHNPTQPVLSGPQPGQVTAGPRKPAGCVGRTCPNLHALFLQLRTPACLIPPCLPLCPGPLVQCQLGPCPLTGLLDRKASQHQFGRGSVCVLQEEGGGSGAGSGKSNDGSKTWGAQPQGPNQPMILRGSQWSPD